MMRGLFQALRGRIGLLKHRVLKEARARSGTARQQEELGLLPRPHYAYGMLRAADLARYLGCKQVTVCEFGVATGNGLLAMVDLASRLKPETGVEYRIVGFDTGTGLPSVGGYEDHPELWSPGDFAMVNKDQLTERLSGRADLFLGDIKDTMFRASSQAYQSMHLWDSYPSMLISTRQLVPPCAALKDQQSCIYQQ